MYKHLHMDKNGELLAQNKTDCQLTYFTKYIFILATDT